MYDNCDGRLGGRGMKPEKYLKSMTLNIIIIGRKRDRQENSMREFFQTSLSLSRTLYFLVMQRTNLVEYSRNNVVHLRPDVGKPAIHQMFAVCVCLEDALHKYLPERDVSLLRHPQCHPAFENDQMT